jgi:hypothetical protein
MQLSSKLLYVVVTLGSQTGCAPLNQGDQYFEDVQVLGVAQWELNQQMGWSKLLRRLNSAADKKQS